MSRTQLLAGNVNSVRRNLTKNVLSPIDVRACSCWCINCGQTKEKCLSKNEKPIVLTHFRFHLSRTQSKTNLCELFTR